MSPKRKFSLSVGSCVPYIPPKKQEIISSNNENPHSENENNSVCIFCRGSISKQIACSDCKNDMGLCVDCIDFYLHSIGEKNYCESCIDYYCHICGEKKASKCTKCGVYNAFCLDCLNKSMGKSKKKLLTSDPDCMKCEGIF